MNAELPDPASVTVTAPRATVLRRIVRWTLGVFAGLVIVLALAFGAVRVALVHVPDYRDQIQAWVNDTTHLDFRFRELDARWRVFGPELFVTNAEVYVPDGGPLLVKARAASFGVDLWRVLFRAELLAGRIRLIEPNISLIRTREGRIEIAGQDALDRERRFSLDNLPTGRLEIVAAQVSFADQLHQIKPFSLSGVKLRLERDRDDLQLDGAVDLPRSLGKTLEFSGTANGQLSEPEALAWRIEADGRELDLRGWQTLFGAALRLPASGRGRVRAQVALKGLQLDAAGLRLDLTNVALAPSAGWTEESRYPVIAGEFDWERSESGWQLLGRKVELTTTGQKWTPSEFDFEWTGGAEHPMGVNARASFLRLENLLPLTALAPAGRWREQLLALKPEGEIGALELSYASNGEEPPQITGVARFSNLGFDPTGSLPGLRGLAGKIESAGVSGLISIDASSLMFLMPQKFRTPLAADVARGQLVWNRSGAGWHLSSRQFVVDNPHVSTVTDLDLEVPATDVSPVLKLRSRFRNAVLTEGWRYLPADKLSERVLAWLDNAFVAGRAPSGELVFDGPTRSFPFRDGGGEFRISFPVEGLVLNYASRWPRVEDAALDVEFHNAGVTGTVRSALVNGLKVQEGVARFADFKQGDLAITARATGDLGAALGFLQKSPVGVKLGPTFMNLRGGGPVATDIELLLPVKHIQDHHISVVARIDRGAVQLEGGARAVEQLQGTIKYLDRQMSGAAITGSYLGGPLRADLSAEQIGKSAEYDNVIRVRAQTPALAFARALDAPATFALDGVIDWRAVMHVPIGSDLDQELHRPVNLRIDSSLRGAGIGLPAPLTKATADTRPLRIDIQWPQPDLANARILYGPNLRAQLQFAGSDLGWRFKRGGVRFGDGEVRLPAAEVLDLNGSLDSLDLSAWLALRSDQPAKRPVSDYLRSADLHVGELRLWGMRFPNVSATLLGGERAWSVSVDGPNARGTVLVPHQLTGPEPLVINMARLNIPELEPGQGGEAYPSNWPAVKASVGQLQAWGKQLGFVRAELKRIPQGLSLESATSQSASFTANSSGSWVVTPEGQRGALKLSLASTDMQQTLKDLGYGASLTGQHGVLEFDLTWPGAPDGQLISRLSGTASVEIDNGQLLNVQPGAGRVFGLMSIAALPRRLSLDFSDLTDKGLSFDKIRGDFTLRSGDAFTTNLLLKGPAAEIGIAGRTGLGSHDYDQTAVVTGSIGNSLPLAGALAGGPVVGAALLLFTQVFKAPLKGIARGYYRITGSWDNPTVQRVDASTLKKAENSVHAAGEG